jgi:hypothetical protein
MPIPRSTVLNNAQLAPNLGTLQHEREFDQRNAWVEHWARLQDDQTKVNFLLMLKARRDSHDDKQARFTLNHLTQMWLNEKYVP